MNFKIFQNKRVLVTGHTGFKGSWLISVLKYFGAEISGYSLAPNRGEMFELIEGERIVSNHTVADIRDIEDLEKEIVDFKPDIIFHLAAQSLVLASYEDPKDTITTNVLGTVNLVEILRRQGLTIPSIIITTDKVYKNDEKKTFFKEDDPFGGKDIYSSSKAATEILVSSYSDSFPELRLITARAGNVIGGGDFSENRLLPDLIRAIESGEKLRIRYPSAVRPWQHVLESLSGYLILGSKLLSNSVSERAYNFGPIERDHLTVKEMIEYCQKSIDSPISVEYEKNPLHEAGQLNLDSTLSRSSLGWESKWDVWQAIDHSLEWYFADSGDKSSITMSQIESYFDS